MASPTLAAPHHGRSDGAYDGVRIDARELVLPSPRHRHLHPPHGRPLAALAPPRLEPAAAATPRPHTPRGLPPAAAATTFLRHAAALTLASSRPAPSPRHPPRRHHPAVSTLAAAAAAASPAAATVAATLVSTAFVALHATAKIDAPAPRPVVGREWPGAAPPVRPPHAGWVDSGSSAGQGSL